MTVAKYVVMATRIRAFETLEDALAFARLNVPAVVLERRDDGQGGTIAVEILRHDWLYDAERKEWRVMLG